ncbi:response regulator [Calothrix sp. PCC 6303]|uniref:response regulator n=1 Tax=Calothrix sp. PCC 6303 TaxID=1170562 RepID=UPI0002A042DF|nr:response regulator [Calothrix sp. PCC 6303]AFZ02390.1 response regulator receiver protein [Calothrix sp. PCC 6303]
MQGNLNEIDIRSILQLIELGQRTGILFVETDTENHYQGGKQTSQQTLISKSYWYRNQQKCWLVFFEHGKIVYAIDGNHNLSRLQAYLRHYRLQVRLSKAKLAASLSSSLPEYACLWLLISENTISLSQAHSIIHSFIQEAIFDLLSLYQGTFSFKSSSPLTPQLATWETTALVAQIMPQVQEWKQLYPYIDSPEQLPHIVDMLRLKASLPVKTVDKLQRWADGKTSLRQLSRYLNRDILTVARAIYPYVHQGWLKMVYKNSYNPEAELKKQCNQQHRQELRIVCINDNASTSKSIESILRSHNHQLHLQQSLQIHTFTNPFEALAHLFQIQPHLILCDIMMPELNGYEICAMLRHSEAFRYLPILMLLNKDSMIYNIKSTIAGATDYLITPFQDTELLILVNKYLTFS